MTFRIEHQKILLTIAKVIVLLGSFITLHEFVPAFAENHPGTNDTTSHTCSAGKPYCYDSTNVVWVYVEFTSGQTVDLSQRSLIGPYSASGYGYPQTSDVTGTLDCSMVPDAKGAYILSIPWYKMSDGKLSGYFLPVPNRQTKGSFANFDSIYVTTDFVNSGAFVSYPGLGRTDYEHLGYYYPRWGTGDDSARLFYGDKIGYVETDPEYVHQRYIEWAGAESTTNAQIDWDIGNFNWFCGADEAKTSIYYSSKSNAYDPSSNIVVSSGYVDGQTSKTLDVSMRPGQEITLYFNHYLRGSSATYGNTNWKVIRTMRISGDTHGNTPSFTDVTNGGTSNNFSTLNSPSIGLLETTNTDEHSVPNSTTNRQVKIAIPSVDETADLDYTITICEYIYYQKNNETTTDHIGETHVCAKIRVTKNNTLDSTTDNPETPSISAVCPLSYFSAPATGTKDSGTTATASGIISNIFTEYSTFIYAKPTDLVSWAHCYNPEAQTVRYTDETDDEPTDTDPASSAVGPQDGIVSSQNKATLSTTNTNSFTPSVGFSVASGGLFTLSGSTINGQLGNNSSAVIYSATQALSYKINTGYAGTTATQSISTDKGTNSVSGHNSWSWTYTYTCTKYTDETDENGDPIPEVDEDGNEATTSCSATGSGSHTGNYFYSITESTSWGKSSEASFYIPYNFTTSVSTNISQSLTDRAQEEIVLAGEKITVDAEISILPRNNTVTRGTYATEPPADTKVEVVTFYLTNNDAIPSGSSSASTSSVCSFYGGRGAKQCELIGNYSSRSAWMHSSLPALNTGSVYSLSSSTTTYNIPVGYRICSAVGISHTDSGDDTNNNGAGVVNSNWNISSPTCRSVAKNPSLQIWGGSLFTNGAVKTSSTTKRALGTTVGSWSEFMLVAGGTSSEIKGMASGAYLGYNNSYSVNPNQGGSSNSKFYTRTALAIANNNCIDNTECNQISSSGIIQNSTIANRLIARYVTPASDVGIMTSNNINLSTQGSYGVYNGYRLTHTRGSLTISSSASLAAGVTHIVYVENGDLTIASNLTYDETNSGFKYNTINQIPQFVIIVKNGNINIQSHVTRIDAWLIAENGNVDTCYGMQIGGNLSASNCGNKLTFNGPIIARTILPKRAFGAGAQDSSGLGGINFNDEYNVTSAEIFNMSLSAYLWSYAQALDSPQAYTVYTRTLAPRL